MQYKVTYMARSGNEDDATVDVRETTDATGGKAFYAKHLQLWGCGKNGATPEQAIRLLAQDMATVLHIARID